MSTRLPKGLWAVVYMQFMALFSNREDMERYLNNLSPAWREKLQIIKPL